MRPPWRSRPAGRTSGSPDAEGDPVGASGRSGGAAACLERISPRGKIARDVRLAAYHSARDAADISAAVVAAVSNGAITQSEAAEVGKLIDSYIRAYGTASLITAGRPYTR